MDEEQFTEMFISIHFKLYRVAYKLLREKDQADDTVQEVYIKLWEKRMELNKLDNAESFAIAILKNACLDLLRKNKRNFSNEEYISNIPQADCSLMQMESRDELNYVARLIKKLPGQYRQVMELKHWGGYSDEEIEQITGMKAVHIRVALSRARKTIREQFKAWNEYGNE